MEPHHAPTHSISPHIFTPSPLSHPLTTTTDEHTIPSYTSMDVTPSAAATLVEMLTRIDALDPLPKLQVVIATCIPNVIHLCTILLHR